MEIPQAVRELALHPFRDLPVPRDVEIIPLDGVIVSFNGWPSAQILQPVGEGPTDVAAVVEQTRALARERGKHTLAWWIAPEHDALGTRLEALGVRNEDTPGFEAVENGLALVEPPPLHGGQDVDVRIVDSWEDYLACTEVIRLTFGMPEVPEADLRDRYDEFLRREPTSDRFAAFLDGAVVGTAAAARAEAGVNLFGGSVVEHARGRGVYSALLRARWEYAVDHGTPALTVQAGKMSRPICERVGFVYVGAARVFVDSVD